MKWQPIETAPKDGTWILVTGWDGGLPNPKRYYCTCRFDKDWGSFLESSDYVACDDFTHWMPLPDSPEELTVLLADLSHRRPLPVSPEDEQETINPSY